ncbi:MAG: hypothetical protein R2744_10515 [Bacteroidales bacterium]
MLFIMLSSYEQRKRESPVERLRLKQPGGIVSALTALLGSILGNQVVIISIRLKSVALARVNGWFSNRHHPEL